MSRNAVRQPTINSEQPVWAGLELVSDDTLQMTGYVFHDM